MRRAPPTIVGRIVCGMGLANVIGERLSLRVGNEERMLGNSVRLAQQFGCEREGACGENATPHALMRRRRDGR
jgi:hypothetical protein